MKSGVTLRGAGPTLTKIHHYASGLSYNDGVIEIGGAASWGTGVAMSSGSLAKGTVDIALASGSSFSVGDYVAIDQTNDGTIVVNPGTSGINCNECGRRGVNGTRALGQVSQVTGKPSANVITVDPPLHQTYSSSLSPQVLRLGSNTNFITYAGIEDVTVEEKYSSAINYTVIVMQYAHNCWLKNVRIQSTAVTAQVQMWTTLRCEIRDSYLGPDIRSNTTTYRYNILAIHFPTANLIENNILETDWGSVTLQASSGNVTAYNYFTDGTAFTTTVTPYSLFYHGGYNKMNLEEGNYGYKMTSDSWWGSNGYNTSLRSYWGAYQASPLTELTASRWPITLYKWNRYMNVVGNVLGNPYYTWTYEVNGSGCNWSSPAAYQLDYPNNNCSSWADTDVKTTLLRHGNYDYATKTTKWCDGSGGPGCQGGGGASDHVIPKSLYLTAKPSWWCNEIPWPAIGSDLSPMVSSIPAKRRAEGLVCTLGGTADMSAPTVTAFSIPSSSASLTVAITSFVATDEVKVTGYLVTESAAVPSASAPGWSASAPTNYAFATAGSKTLYAWAKDASGKVSAGKSASVVVDANGCVSSELATWQNSAFAAVTGPFTVEFDAVPGASNMDGVTQIALGAASAFTSLAMAVRFNPLGYIDARNGSAYEASATVPYTAGTYYHFRLHGDVAARVYTIYVTSLGSPEVLLGQNYAFRSEQSAVTSLDHWSMYSAVGSHIVCDFAVVAGRAAPASPANLRILP